MLLRLLLVGLFLAPLSAFSQPWVMFNDNEDTYLYDQASGMVYIRTKKGGKNYEDEFVPMGVKHNSNAKSAAAAKGASNNAPTNGLEILQSLMPSSDQNQRDLILKQAQEMQRSLQNSLYGGDTQTP